MCGRGLGAFFRGEWGAARVDFEQALAVIRQMGRSWVSAGPLAFGPEGVLFIGDPQGAAIFAIDTGDRPSRPAFLHPSRNY